MIVFQTPNIEIDYNSVNKQIVQTWYNYVPSVDFRQAIDFTVDFIRKNHVISIISDTLKQNVVKPEDSEYAAKVMGQLFNDGVQAMAFVMPDDIFTKISLKKFADIELNNQHKVEYFLHKEDAENWIKSIT